MQDKGINSTFKKIIYESSEMVFLADDSYPYSIFYGNESFEEEIGGALKEKTLVGLGLDINAYIFKEELILSHGKKDFSFKLELPQDSGSNYFLFYKGKEVKTHGLPSRREAYQFFTSKLDLIAIGKYDHLTYLNSTVLSVLGYEVEELLNTNLCPFIHEDDLERVQKIWKAIQKNQEVTFLEFRFLGKDGNYRHLECSIQFNPETFFVIARDVSYRHAQAANDKKLDSLRDEVPEMTKSGKWKFDLEAEVVVLDQSSERIIEALLDKEVSLEATQLSLLNQIKETVATLDPMQQEFAGQLSVSRKNKVNYTAFFPEKGKSIVWGVIWDKSQSQRIQQDLDFYTKAWMECPEAMIIVKPNGEVVLANQEVIQLFGFEKNTKISHLEDLSVFFEEAYDWSEWINSAKGDTTISRFSTLLINERGNQLTLELAVSKMEFDQAEFFTLSFRNISEKIHLEKEVEASSNFLMNLTDQVPGGLYQLVLNTEGQMNFSFLSKGINSVLGLSPQKIHEFTDISSAISKVHPQDLPQVIMSSVASARKLEPWQCQFRVKSGENNQEYQWVLGAARPQALENGDMVWYGYLTDISKQKEFEAKLDEARMAAEKANQIKSDFLSMISHELRTPLNAISGSVYSLFQEDHTENQKSALNTINFAVDNLIIMINDLLDFQKIEAGKLTIEQVPFNLQNLLEQVLKGLSFHAKDSKNKLDLHLSEGLNISVKGDKTRLSQVMNNLITNALKFTPSGNVDVKVELLSQVKNKVKVYFEVKDTGIGIAPEHQEKIFDDFDQVKPTFNSKYGGTGLGLSITRKLLNLMGGKIKLESEVGKGSRFFFELEFEKAEESLNSIPRTESNTPSYAGLHLLMAEDNEVNSLVLGKIIKKWGYTYERVHDGKEAVEAARKGKFDCILMDIQMPVMDGFEATVEIKKFSDTPIIALTAAAKLEIMERIDACEFEGFVAKPIDAAELLKKIKEVIAEKIYKS
ncbi:ATP-binding protein [Algoriphagus boritolerans]|uniref:histidine kinase n=1 Tax=Algoriphagus boritolerans DSM 17298 = JCM 18970 TaxID=1120964 RepID=A0A1H5X030_9BACT|nr:ATP-binding protein [Algoriphagus boritolerans]SEG04835.1 PAS domain S-box-containing protein [Algoriphagus boritolerans DSM 17298 = JCM 18970]